MATAEGRKTILFLLEKLGYFSPCTTDEQIADRNAAVKVLDWITQESGFVLSRDLVLNHVEPPTK
jgi:hypothetical protein